MHERGSKIILGFRRCFITWGGVILRVWRKIFVDRADAKVKINLGWPYLPLLFTLTLSLFNQTPLSLVDKDI